MINPPLQDHSQILLQNIVEGVPIRVFWKDRDLRYLGCNTLFANDAGLTCPDEVIGKTDFDLGWKDQAEIYRADDLRVMESEAPKLAYVEPQTSPDGQTIWLRTSKVPLRDANQIVIGILGIYEDITAQKQAEETRKKLTRALNLLSKCNSVLVHARDEQELLADICQLAVDSGGYLMAWVGFAENDADKTVRPVAQSGLEEEYLDIVNITWSDTERGRGPTGTAIRTGITLVNQNCLANPNMAPWREAAIKHGYQSSIALPLAYENRVLGALTIYAPEPDAFIPEEVKLLEELANDLAYGIEARRTRVERTRAVDALRESEEKLRGLYELSPLGFALTDMNGRYVEFNEAFGHICGYAEEELKALDYWTLTPKKYEADEARQLQSLTRTGRYGPYEKEYVRKDGRFIPLRLNGVLVTGRDGQKYIWSIVEDITESKQAEKALKRESEKNLAFLHNASDGVHILDTDGNIIEVSDSFCEMLGYRRDEVIGMNVTQWDAQLNEAEITQNISLIFAQNSRSQFETVHRRKDGSVLDVEVSSYPLELEGKRALFNSSRDITERRKAEASLKESEVRFRTVIEQSPIGVSFSRDGKTVDVANAAYVQMFGYDDVAEVRGQDVINLFAPQCRGEIEDRVRRRIQGEQLASTYESIGLRKDGSQFPLFVSANRVMLSDGALTYAFVIDFTERKAAEEKIKHLAFYDQLTDLPNRQLLNDRLQHALASSRRSGRQGALLFIDLDNFKALNDTLGHDIGDLLLIQVAQRLASCTREGDTLARLGGDEFMVMLEGLSVLAIEAAEQTKDVGAKILAALSQPYQLAAHEYHCTTSIGATLFNLHRPVIEELLKQADIAMYQAKKAGRNTLRFFDPEMQNIINTRVALEGELRKALQNRQFHLHYQIQVDETRRPIGVEALIRWAHPERGMVPPVQFIPLAEETGLILPIGQWALGVACAQLKSWEGDEQTRNLVLAVNISAKQFHLADFVTQVNTAVQRHAINPKLLKLELTESLLLEDIEDTITTMNALKGIGIQFSLDDFGTGYSSLQYLKRLPLNQIKIDQSFVRDIATDTNDSSIVSTIIAMAKSLDLDVIAEGVETEDQRQLLLSKGCTHYQGYLFSKPVPREQFELLIKRM